MSFIDEKFIGMISSRLEKFKIVKPGLYNFRCPICGDSKKNKSKSRGYLYLKKSDLNYKCHNCGATSTFAYFLKGIDESLYKEYVMERYKVGLTGKGTVVPNPKIVRKIPQFTYSIFKDLPKISDLNITHVAREYLTKRQIPEQYYSNFYYVEDFNSWSKSTSTYKESRIILPLKNFDGKVFGLDRVDIDKTVYIVEGPFDSLFVSNGIAMCGSDVYINDLQISDYVWVYDNEPRNLEIHSRMLRNIKIGNKIVIWPSSIIEKDINDMILGGNNIQSIIENNTFQGIKAQLKFTEWKKV